MTREEQKHDNVARQPESLLSPLCDVQVKDGMIDVHEQYKQLLTPAGYRDKRPSN